MIGYGYNSFSAGWLLIAGYWLLIISRDYEVHERLSIRIDVSSGREGQYLGR